MMLLRNSNIVSSFKAITNGEISTLNKRFYSKRLVSKRVYEKLKKEKVNWKTIKTPDEFEALCKPVDTKPIDSIKPVVSSMIQNIEKYLQPNTTGDGNISKELEVNQEMGTDLQILISRIKYQQPDDFEEEEVEVDNRLLRRQRIKTAKQILKEYEDKVDLTNFADVMPWVTPKMLAIRKLAKLRDLDRSKIELFQVNRDNYLKSQEKQSDEFNLDNSDENEFKFRSEEDQDENEKISLAQQIKETRQSQQMQRNKFKPKEKKEKIVYNRVNSISFKTIPPSDQPRAKTRFHYKAGKGSALYEYSKYQLQELNRLEELSIKADTERSAYDKK